MHGIVHIIPTGKTKYLGKDSAISAWKKGVDFKIYAPNGPHVSIAERKSLLEKYQQIILWYDQSRSDKQIDVTDIIE